MPYNLIKNYMITKTDVDNVKGLITIYRYRQSISYCPCLRMIGPLDDKTLFPNSCVLGLLLEHRCRTGTMFRLWVSYSKLYKARRVLLTIKRKSVQVAAFPSSNNILYYEGWFLGSPLYTFTTIYLSLKRGFEEHRHHVGFLLPAWQLALQGERNLKRYFLRNSYRNT